MNDLIVGLDIGSNTIRMVVGQRVEQANDHNSSVVQIIGFHEVPSEGVRRGVITNIEDAVSSLSNCIEKIERMTGRQLESILVGITGTHITSQESRGVVAVSRPSGEINEEDIERAISAARTVVTPLNHEILHVIPRSFSVDGQGGIKDPSGMTGIRLEVDTQIIQGLSSHIKNLTKSVYRTGLEIDDIVLSILAASESVLSKKQKEMGCILIDIGGPTTSIIIFEEGDVLYTSILPIGSDYITADIAIGLRRDPEVAERVKLKYGTALPFDVKDDENIDLGEVGDENGVVSRKYVAEIIEARVDEIFDKIDCELKKISRSGLLPAGAILIGGGAKMPGITEVAKAKLRIPVSLGYPRNVYSAIEKINDISYGTAMGLVRWGEQVSLTRIEKPKTFSSRLKIIQKIGSKLRGWFKGLKP